MPDIPFRSKAKAITLAVQILRALAPADREAVWVALQVDDSRCRVPICRGGRELHRRYCYGHQKRFARYGDPLAHIPLGRKTEVRLAADRLRA